MSSLCRRLVFRLGPLRGAGRQSLSCELSGPWLAGRHAFSLVELLVVMAIILVLAGLAGPAASSLLKGTGVTQSNDVLEEQIAMARQLAIAKNRLVEVRFYQFGDPDFLGESASDPSSGKFRAIQCYELKVDFDGTGQAVTNAIPITKLQRLPNSVIIDSGPTLSSLVGKAGGASPFSASGSSLNQSLPRIGKNYNTVGFRFRADGSTDLPKSGGPWFVTTHDLNKGDKLSSAPPNFATLVIDPYNGNAKPYRP